MLNRGQGALATKSVFVGTFLYLGKQRLIKLKEWIPNYQESNTLSAEVNKFPALVRGACADFFRARSGQYSGNGRPPDSIPAFGTIGFFPTKRPLVAQSRKSYDRDFPSEVEGGTGAISVAPQQPLLTLSGPC